MGQLFEVILLIAGLVLSNVVHAHFGAHGHGSFSSGLLHPFSGLDHLLAMFAVGAWAARSGGRALYMLPMLFVVAMAAGAGLGAAYGVPGGAMPIVESGMAISVLVLGTLIALSVDASRQWAIPLVAGFALCHGYSHGVEMPVFADRWAYFAGFMLATTALHASGVLSAGLLRDRAAVLKGLGFAISLAGAWIVLAG